MSQELVDQGAVSLGQVFLESLSTQDFDRLEALFAPQTRFRALVPATLREGQTDKEATDWLRTWFGHADTLEVLDSEANQVFDRLYLSYRLRTHEPEKGWRDIEQHGFCSVQNGHIAEMWLVCSGFRPEPEKRLRR